MPLVGEFHRNFWRARANTPPPPAAVAAGGYPVWESSIILVSMIGWVPLSVLGDAWARLRWVGRMLWRAWCFAWATPARPGHLQDWIRGHNQPDPIWIADALWHCTPAQLGACRQVLRVLTAPYWDDAAAAVGACAVTMNFSDPKMWQTYSRLLRENAGQAQNVYRHVKVVHALRSAHPDLSNPDAHLLAELAYQAFTADDRRDRVIVTRTILERTAHSPDLVTH